MTNFKPMAASAALILATVTLAGAQEEKVLNIYNWYDYVGETTIADFEKETGIKVNYDIFDSNEILEAKLMSGSTGYDIVVPASNFLARQITAGLFLKIDREKLTNFGNLAPELLSSLAVSDPGNSFAVPYTWGTTGIGYDADKIKARMPDAPTDSWDLVFKPENLQKFADCGVAMVDSPAEIMAAALNYLGKDPNSEDKADLLAAQDLMMSIRPYIKHFNSGQIINDLAGGEICIAVAYSGDISIAKARAAETKSTLNIAYIIPKEGAQIFFDTLAIPTDAPHPENALAFMNYLLRPEVIAGVTNKVFFANANAKAAEFVAPEILKDPGIYPTADVRAKLFPLKAHAAKFDRLLTRAWTAIKAGG